MRRKTLLVLSLTALLVVGATASGLAGRVKISHNTPASTVTPVAIDPIPIQEKLADEAPSDIQVVLLALRTEGFEPTEVNLSAGEYLFVVRNRSGLDEVDLRLVRENGEHLGQSKVHARRSDWKQRMKLTPGVYLLSETGHPEWTCRVVVER